ncbi:hypothetical protein R1sor_003646 [Riccia sorocarpa]|uniref:PGG domain-containing protein n=1 Tax=Riccia sorocarpa TaxID=122646 RepID=A0ABD3H8C3_9MARC
MQDEKTSFGGAGSAVSVTTALVATASYIGPLQPPLGYSGEDQVQTEIPAVRVFFVLNTLAFYLTIAAVVLSLTPALPVANESTHGELKHIRRSVIWALLFLIISLIAILSAFASASVVVIPNAERWLTIAPVVIGCVLCVVMLILCYIRAIKLVSKNSVAGRSGDDRIIHAIMKRRVGTSREMSSVSQDLMEQGDVSSPQAPSASRDTNVVDIPSVLMQLPVAGGGPRTIKISQDNASVKVSTRESQKENVRALSQSPKSTNSKVLRR